MLLLGMGLLLSVLGVLLKRNNVLYLIQLTFLWVVASFNNSNPDYINYINGYKYSDTYTGKITEPLYWVLVKIGKTIGLNYQMFRCLFFLLCIMILGYGIWKMANYPNCVVGLYFVYPFAMDVIQMRTFFANSLVIAAICFVSKYREENRLEDFIISVVLMAGGVGFHYSAALCFIVYLLLLDWERPIEQMIKIGTIILSGIVFFLLWGGRVYEHLVTIGVFNKANQYQEKGLSFGGYAISVIALRILLIMLCFLALHMPKIISEENRIIISRNTFFAKCVYLLSIYAAFEVTVSLEMERVSRISLILTYSIITNIVEIGEKKNSLILYIMMFVFVAFNFYFMMFRHFSTGSNWFHFSFLPVFVNNIL